MMEETITEVTNETPVVEVVDAVETLEEVATPVESIEENVTVTVDERVGGGTDTIYH